MTSYIPDNSIETTSTPMTTLKFTWKTSLFPEKTKLETYVDILARVANPSQFQRKMNCKPDYASKVLENRCALDFLSELGLIKHHEEESETNIDYYVTQRGKAVLKYFKYFDNLETKQKTRALKRP